MPDLELLFDDLLNEVRGTAHAPGAPAAVQQARRRRRRGVVAAAAAAVVLTAGGVAVGGLLVDDGDAVSPADRPDAPSSLDEAGFRSELGKALTGTTGWAVSTGDPTILFPCSDDWSGGAGGAGGSVGVGPGAGGGGVFHSTVGFPDAPGAATAVARLVGALESCAGASWQVRPVTGTGALLASSPDGVVWIAPEGASVSLLEVPTDDGPPPAEVQAEVVALLRAVR
ncbi:hypothetical protein L615_000400000510 [Nocardioides sp. J9]|uniref:hypothetical protein n=1 Tax=Nocardioides sp. J9 TaxID=935844 RepID=UPI00119D9C48|nr:hypothetical protein [Nocardioides sp. J9]TWG96949.1 hypothetical protein L615_000400000510 [Nocardioides sp. J9]